MYLPNLKFIALPVPDITGGTKKFEQSLDTPTLPFLSNFLRAFVRMDPVNVSTKFTVYSFPVPEIVATAVLAWGCEPPIFGKGRP